MLRIFQQKCSGKKGVLTLTCCNISSPTKNWHLDIDDERSDSWIQVHMTLYVYVLY